eukprot:c2945_g1_i1 orf=103-489(+)
MIRKYFFNNVLLNQLSPSYGFLGLAPKLRTGHFCTAVDDKGEEGNDKDEKFRKKMDQLRELKRQMDELDKKYDSYFTVDYALGLAKKGFKDSDDDEYADSSDSDKASLEISGPSADEISSSEDDDYNR